MDYLIGLSSLLSYVLLYKYLALFVLVFLAAVGAPIPGNTIVMAVGAFASQNYFSFWLSLAVAVLGNISGDIFEYWLVRKYGKFLIDKYHWEKMSFVKKFEQYIEPVERYIKKHEGATVFVSRFLGAASPVVNFFAGLIPVPFGTFALYDALGNFVDTLLALSLGFFISDSWEAVAGAIGILGAVVTVLVVLAVVIGIRIYRKKRR